MHKSGVVLVTGASTGIGHDAALALAKKEPKLLVFAGVRSKEAGKAIDALGLENLKPLALDVTSDKSVDSAHKAIAKEMAQRGDLPFVGLVNNAGVSAVRGRFLLARVARVDGGNAMSAERHLHKSLNLPHALLFITIGRSRGVRINQGRAGDLRREFLWVDAGHAEASSAPPCEQGPVRFLSCRLSEPIKATPMGRDPADELLSRQTHPSTDPTALSTSAPSWAR